MPARKPKMDEKPQSERFIETARKIGADEAPEAFERVFKQIVQPRAATAEKKPLASSSKLLRDGD